MKYKVILEVNNDKFVGSAEELAEALLKVNQPVYKTKGILTVEYGQKSYIRTLNWAMMRRIFNEREVNRIVASKWLKSFLK